MCEPLIDAKSAAKILLIHPVTIREMATRGELPAMKIGRVWRFRASSLDAWLTSQLQSTRHPHPLGDE
jgi:excisionase family DNA binding protein